MNTKKEVKAIKQLSKVLSSRIINKLQNALSIPAGIMKNEPIKFIYALKDWKDFNPQTFDTALQYIGGTILTTAREIKWLSDPLYVKPSKTKIKPTKAFVNLLVDEMIIEDWIILVRTTTNIKVKEDIEGKGIIKLLVENKTITQDLKELCEFLEELERNDLAIKVLAFRPAFQKLSPSQFQGQIKNEIKQREKDYCARLSSILYINAFAANLILACLNFMAISGIVSNCCLEVNFNLILVYHIVSHILMLIDFGQNL